MEPSSLIAAARAFSIRVNFCAPQAEISSVCRQIVLEAGRHGKTIGKDLIAVEMDRTGHTHSSHYSEDERGSDTRS